MSHTFTARWVFPVSGPPIPGGRMTVADSRIVAVGESGPFDTDLGNVALIPGLVNAHTHLDLSGARVPPTDPDHFTDWLRGVIAFRRGRSADETQADIRAGLAECLRFGTTLIGDITSGGASWQAVSTASVRSLLFWEIIGLTEEKFTASLNQWSLAVGGSWDDGAPPATMPGHRGCGWGVSPHAPYSVHHDSARAQMLISRTAMHLAESPAEMELIATKSGPFVPFLKDLGVWDETAFTASVTDLLFTWPQAQHPRLVVHGNYLPVETASLFHPTMSLVYCPRTHAAFGHPPHPFREFLARGVRVCLGTDSLASNPDLDVLAEAQFVRQEYPDVPGDVLLRMVTLSGAEALGRADECGSLDVGKWADFVAIPVGDEPDAYEALFAAPTAPRRTWFAGRERL